LQGPLRREESRQVTRDPTSSSAWPREKPKRGQTGMAFVANRGNEFMHYRAIHRYADMSPRKVRPVAALIRGRMADEALELLRYLPSRSARLVEQVLKSALGNAENRDAADIEGLVVSESRVDGGPIMKRIMPRARGTAYPIKRRYAHIHVVLWDGQEEPEQEE